MKEKLKKNEAITLISLVVTIIVLIILAGISINLILGQDGIINKAKEAKQNMEYAQVEEQEQLNEVYEYLELGTIGVGSSNDKVQEIASKYQKLQNEYNALKEEHTNLKKSIANAITEMGVETSEQSDSTTMVNSIKNIKGSSPSIIFFNDGATYTAIGSEQIIDLKSYDGFENLVLNENLFLVLTNEAAIVSHYDYDRTSVISNLGFTYDASTGTLAYYVKLNNDKLNMNYYNSVQFKILIVG